MPVIAGEPTQKQEIKASPVGFEPTTLGLATPTGRKRPML